MPSSVSFDVWNTLMKVHWTPLAFGEACLDHLGLVVTDDRAAEAFHRHLEFKRADWDYLHAKHDIEGAVRFWDDFLLAWASELLGSDLDEGRFRQEIQRQWSEEQHRWFSLFPDVVPALDLLKSSGCKLVALTNWDLSVHQVFRAAQIDSYFSAVVTSKQFGEPKPSPAIFLHACRMINSAPADVVHIGDDYVGDYQGAQAAGLKALWLHRSGNPSATPVPGWRAGIIRSLSEIPEWLRII